MGTVTFGKLLPGKVEAVHGSCSVSSFFPPSAFRKVLPQQKNARRHCLQSDWIIAENLTSPGLLWAFVFEATRHGALTLSKCCLEFDLVWRKVALAEGVSE